MFCEINRIKELLTRIGYLEVFIFWVCKNWLQKMCKIFASELGFKCGVIGGFQKGITLGGSTSGSVKKVSVGGVVGGWLDYIVTLSPY